MGVLKMSNCRTCKYFDGHTCRKTGFDTHHSNMCNMHEPKRETKQMKDYIVEKHEVKLNDIWHVVEPIVNTEHSIMFSDPRPATIPQPAAPCAPTPGAFKVTHLMISKNDDYYRTSRVVRVMLNQDLDIVEKMKANYAEAEPSPGCFYATVILD